MTALAINMDYAAIPTPASAFVDFLAALANTERNVKDAMKETNDKMDLAEKRLRSSIEQVKRMVETAESASIAQLPLQADALLEKAEWTELRIRTEHEQLSKVVDQLSRLLRRHVPRLAKPIEPVMERYHRVSDWYIAEFQEMRWRIMALRAEQYRSERGPIFDNSKDLARHLGTLIV